MTQPNPRRVLLLATNNSHTIIGEIVDGKTNTIAYSTYDEQSAQQEVETRLGFNGQLREGNIGWYLLGNGYRAYNPRLMRFHSPDSWSPFGRGGLNAYKYCVGDPVNRSDPTGHMSFLKFMGRTFDFFFGGADVTGPRRLTLERGQIESLLGGMSPEKTGEGRALARVGGAIMAGAPVKTTRGLSPGGDVNPQGVGGWEPPRPGTRTPWIVSRTAQDSHSPGARSPAGSFAGRPTQPGPPPTYEVATSATKLWNNDTFAASQRGKTLVVNRVEQNGHYYNFHPPRMEHPQLPYLPPPPPPPPRPRSPSPWRRAMDRTDAERIRDWDVDSD